MNSKPKNLEFIRRAPLKQSYGSYQITKDIRDHFNSRDGSDSDKEMDDEYLYLYKDILKNKREAKEQIKCHNEMFDINVFLAWSIRASNC